MADRKRAGSVRELGGRPHPMPPETVPPAPNRATPYPWVSGGQPGLSVSYHGMESRMSFDTLRAVETLQDVGFQARQAKAIVGTMNEAVGEQLALKTDVGALKTDVGTLKTDVGALKTDVGTLKTDVGVLKTDIAALKTDIAELKAATRADIAELKATTKTDVAGLKTDIAELKAALTWRIVLAMGAFAALVRLLP